MISGADVNRRTRVVEGDPAIGRVQSAGFATAMCLCAITGLALVAKTDGTSDASAAVEIDSTINPNDASPASLARLPGIGPARARAIVSYRTRSLDKQGRPVFHRPEDLQAIPGIGVTTSEAIRPWLSFDQPESAK